MIFGKLKYFKQKGIKEWVLEFLSLAMGMTIFFKQNEVDPEEEDLGWVLDDPYMAGFGSGLTNWIKAYPKLPSNRKPWTLADEITARTFGLTDIIRSPDIVPGQYDIIHDLKGDKELREFVDKYFVMENMWNEIEIQRLWWCCKLWNDLSST